MGLLSGFRYRDVVRKLRKAGFEFDRSARGSHEIWWNPQTHRRTTVPNHPGELPEGTVRAVVREAGLSPEEFVRLLIRSGPEDISVENTGPPAADAGAPSSACPLSAQETSLRGVFGSGMGKTRTIPKPNGPQQAGKRPSRPSAASC